MNESERVRAWRQKNKKPCPICTNPIDKYSTTCQPCATRLNRKDWRTVTLAEIQSLRGYQRNSRIRDLAHASMLGDKICAACGYDTHVEVCHIKPISSYEPETAVADINHPENLIYLCPNHHWELDNGVLKL